MKSRRIFAAVMASVCAVSATAVAASAAETKDTVLSDTPLDLKDDWKQNIVVDKAKLADAKAGDQIVIALSSVKAECQLSFKYTADKWPAMPGVADNGGSAEFGSIDIATTDTSFTYVFTAEDIETLKTADLAIGGKNAVVDSVTLKSAVTADPDTPAGDKDDNKDDNKPGATDKTDDNKPGATDKTDDNKPGATDKADTVTNDITVDKVLKGADLTKAIFGDSKKEWKDVESVTFESDEPFAVVFNVKAGKIKDDAKATKFIKGVTELAKDEDLPAKAFATKWTLSADEVAAMLDADAKADSLQLISKDGKKITVKATVTTKAASKPDDNKNTGIALVVAPVVLAGAAVAVAAISKKRK